MTIDQPKPIFDWRQEVLFLLRLAGNLAGAIPLDSRREPRSIELGKQIVQLNGGTLATSRPADQLAKPTLAAVNGWLEAAALA